MRRKQLLKQLFARVASDRVDNPEHPGSPSLRANSRCLGAPEGLQNRAIAGASYPIPQEKAFSLHPQLEIFSKQFNYLL